MKKLFLLPVLCALTACGSNTDTVVVMGQNCEKVAVGERGDMLVKCPVVEELVAIRNGTPNAMFLSVNADMVNLEEIAADGEHIYVDVVPAGTFEGQASECYRVLAAQPVFDGVAMYATQVCPQ